MNNWRAVVHRKMQARFGGERLEKGAQRTSSAAYPTHVLAAIQALNRLACVGETLRQALNRIAVVAPEWLQSWVPPEWFDQYRRRFEEYRLPPGKAERYALAEQIGTDGRTLLLTVYTSAAPPVKRRSILYPAWTHERMGSSACPVLGSNLSENTLPEEFEARSPIVGSLDHFQPVHMALGDAIGRLILECGGHGILVAHNALGELHQFRQSTGLSACQPWFQ